MSIVALTLATSSFASTGDHAAPCDGPPFGNREFATAGYTIRIEGGDLNGDGIDDVLAGNSKVSVLLGRGDGTFAEPVELGLSGSDVRLADLDRDGHLDVLVANDCAGGSVEVLMGDGDATFAALASYPVGDGAHQLSVGDMDADGSIDVVVVGDDTIWILPGNGDGSLAPASALATGDAHAVTLGDVNHDEHIDMVAQLGDTTRVFLGDGTGQVSPGRSWKTTGLIASNVIVDFNADGHPDVVGADFARGTLPIRYGDGDGTFGAAGTIAVVEWPWALDVADLDHDGHADLAVALASGGAAIVLNGGIGTAREVITLEVNSVVLSVTCLDADGDADLDVVAAHSQWGNTVSVIENHGNGSFTSGGPDLVLETGAAPQDLVVADFDRDGIPDIAAPCAGTSEVSVMLARPGGTFQSGVGYPVSDHPTAVAAGDVDGDGADDLVAATCGDPSACAGRISILRNRGDATFEPAIDLADGLGAHRVALGDLDGDGDLDLAAVAGDVGGGVAVMLNDGTGEFAEHVTFSSWSARHLALSDIDRDGALDLVVGSGHFESRRIEVYLNHGDAQFADRVITDADSGLTAMAVADLNGDGLPDVAIGTGSQHHADVEVRWGRGDGSLSEPIAYRTAWTIEDLAAADMNGDTHLDLVVGNWSNVSLLLNDGAGGYLPPTIHGVSRHVSSVALADLDGDGATDIATTSDMEDRVSILLNQCPSAIPPCPADLDGSGSVGFDDMLRLLHAWGLCPAGCPEDLDDDGMVDFRDLLLMLLAWGPCE
jgi:hypothetical protein